MLISEGIVAVGNCLYLSEHSSLVLSDLQLGYEEHMSRKGVLLPRHQYELMSRQVENVLKKVQPKTVILAGDIKHEFGDITESEWRLVLKFLDALRKRYSVRIIKGNHDVQLLPILKKRTFSIDEYILLGKIYVCHGHVLPDNKDFRKADTVIIGHEHPAIGLRDSGRIERFKCFLKGKFMGKNLIVLPSSNPLVEGQDIMEGKFLSPFLKKGIADFDVYVVSDRILPFGKVKDIEKVF